MKKYFFELVVLAGFIGLTMSCDNTKQQRNAEQVDSLKSSFLIVKDSLDSIWTTMIEDDDYKLGWMKRLLQEVKNTNVYDEKQIQELLDRIDNTKANRYNQESMGNQELIDEYDFAVSSLIKEIETVATSNPKYENFPLMEELIKEIRDADNRLIIHRIHYDLYAKDYNAFIAEHPDLAKEVDPNDPGVKRNLFQISD